jgi:serine/threonine protein kinase
VRSTAPENSTCPDCNRPLEETSGGRFGCIACFLRAGTSGEDDVPQYSSPEAFAGDEHFGVYEIDRRDDGSLYTLGHGAMGVTYRATDMSLQRKVALKIIRLRVAGRSKEARERFLREARAAGALRHENIATVFQFGIREETGQCFYAMELIEGETLEERVRRTGPLDVSTTIEIAQQVTSALAAAEKRGLIHRDLKPANLMLVHGNESEVVERNRRARRKATGRPKHGTPTVKVIDFGLAKALNAPVDPMRLTWGGFVGTPAFASPEQFENAALDVRSDIYSLGVTLWFALTGRTPVGGHSVGEIRRAQQLSGLPTEQLKAARVPSHLRLLLKSMLAFEPAARPSTHELAAELQRCAAQATGMRRPRVLLAAAAALTAVACWFFVFHSLRTHPAPPASGLNPAVAEKSMDVLPFEDLNGEADSPFLAHGLHEDVLTKVAKIADLEVARTATTPAPFMEIDQTIIPIIGQYRTAPQIAKVRHRDKRVVRVLTRERTLWDKLLYGWDTTPAPFVEVSRVARHGTILERLGETDQTVIPTIGQDRRAPQIAKVRHRDKRVVRVRTRLRTLWDKLRYGWVVEHPQQKKK